RLRHGGGDADGQPGAGPRDDPARRGHARRRRADLLVLRSEFHVPVVARQRGAAVGVSAGLHPLRRVDAQPPHPQSAPRRHSLQRGRERAVPGPVGEHFSRQDDVLAGILGSWEPVSVLGCKRSHEVQMSLRAVKSISQSLPTLEGAGVKLRRAFGFGKTSDFDPFLLLDDFRNEHPEDYLPGFPWHPHRGIETITYVLSGSVQHGDSLGNRGTMGAGDVQWMTAGSGILHQEMPKGDDRGRMHGFQLWANLPRTLKMTAPRYQDIHAPEIPEVVDDDGTRVRVVAGDFWGKRGPVEGVAADPRYLDIWIP